MKKSLLLQLTVAFFFLFTAAGVLAMDMDHGSSHDSANTMDHSGMDMEADMIMLENSMQDGVIAMAHLRDISKKMNALGMEQTHHFMVMFKDHKTDKVINTGIVAVKIIDPAGNEHKAIKLMGMEGSFGADIVLDKHGEYTFEVGTKLSDNTKRQFRFTYISHS